MTSSSTPARSSRSSATTARKTSLIKALCGALVPDSGEIFLDGTRVHFRSPMDARRAGIETVHQTLAAPPGLDIADNLFLGREERKPGILGSVFRMLDLEHMRSEAKRHMTDLGTTTLQNIGQAVESCPASSGRAWPWRGRRRSAARS